MKTSYIVKHLTGSLFFFLIIFVSAGRFLYWPGLIYLALGLIMFALNYTLLKPGDDMLAERSKPGEGAKQWDKTILGLSFLATLAMYVVGGLDSGRFHWSPEFHWSLMLLGAALTVTGQLLFLVAQKQNRFFSSTVRIQTERGHTVCDTGLYSFVRHPAYLGSIVQSIGFPLLFGSLWSIIPVAIMVILQIIRTYFEDKTLQTELPGYSIYSQKTRFRLMPAIW